MAPKKLVLCNKYIGVSNDVEFYADIKTGEKYF
jgi:hypothetical protein